MNVTLWPGDKHNGSLIPLSYAFTSSDVHISRKDGGWGAQGPKREFDSAYNGENCPTNPCKGSSIAGNNKPFHLTIYVGKNAYTTVTKTAKND